jgi:hypothetical protein
MAALTISFKPSSIVFDFFCDFVLFYRFLFLPSLLFPTLADFLSCSAFVLR